MYHKGKLGKLFLQVMVLWEVACLQIRVVHIIFVNVAEGRWCDLKVEKDPVWCGLVLNIHNILQH